MVKKILIGVLLLLVIIQFIRPSKNTGDAEGPNDITHYAQVPDSVMTILKVSCYDCHSNHTNYLWYHEIMPVGWLLNNDVVDGKKHLNFSEFTTYNKKRTDRKLKQIAEEVEEHAMPISSYTWMHKEAIMTDQQIKLVAGWAEELKKNNK